MSAESLGAISGPERRYELLSERLDAHPGQVVADEGVQMLSGRAADAEPRRHRVVPAIGVGVPVNVCPESRTRYGIHRATVFSQRRPLG